MQVDICLSLPKGILVGALATMFSSSFIFGHKGWNFKEILLGNSDRIVTDPYSDV